MQRDCRGRFKKNEGMSIVFPPFWSIVKIVVVSIILYPWYYAITKRGSLDRAMNYVFTIPATTTPGIDNGSPTTKNKLEEVMGSKT